MMIRTTLAAVMVAALTGCTASVEPMGGGGGSGKSSQKTQLAAYAASTEYPSDARADQDLHVAAVVSKKGNSVKLYNFTNEPIRDAKLWVNNSYVRQVDSIPANSSRTITFAELYNNRGTNFSAANAPITSLQVQNGDRLANVLGPANE